MAEADVHIDMGAVERILTAEPEWQHHCEQLAEKAVSYARSIAPVRTGRYRASLYGRVSHLPMEGSASTAPAAEIGSTCDYALEVEFQGPAYHHVLLKSFDHIKE